MNLLDLEKYNLLKKCDGFVENAIDHISSFSMRKSTMFSGLDGVESKISQSRGLFVNNKTGEVIARGFDKFFNINENLDENGECIISSRFTGDVSVYQKENGFLGLVGYDSESKDLFFASKNSSTSDFANRLKELFYELATDDEIVHIRHILKIKNACLVFEVIDVENDLHLIDYDDNKLIVIGLLSRTYDFSEFPYDFQEKQFGNLKNIMLKKKIGSFQNIQSALGFLKHKGLERSEGWVINDKNNNYIKVKSDFYKRIRVLRSYIMAYRTKSGTVKYATPQDLYDYAVIRLGSERNHRELNDEEREMILSYLKVFTENSEVVLNAFNNRKGPYSFVETYAVMEKLALENGLKSFD